MKVNIDWAGLAKAVFKAAWPFLAGALGGLLSGCSVFGPVIGKTAVLQGPQMGLVRSIH